MLLSCSDDLSNEIAGLSLAARTRSGLVPALEVSLAHRPRREVYGPCIA